MHGDVGSLEADLPHAVGYCRKAAANSGAGVLEVRTWRLWLLASCHPVCECRFSKPEVYFCATRLVRLTPSTHLNRGCVAVALF